MATFWSPLTHIFKSTHPHFWDHTQTLCLITSPQWKMIWRQLTVDIKRRSPVASTHSRKSFRLKKNPWRVETLMESQSRKRWILWEWEESGFLKGSRDILPRDIYPTYFCVRSHQRFVLTLCKGTQPFFIYFLNRALIHVWLKDFFLPSYLALTLVRR